MTDTTLVLVYKQPRLGIGKQRLAARFGAELTLQIAEALLACAMDDAAAWPGSVVLAPASESDCDWAWQQAGRFQFPLKVIPQIDGNLGQRLNALDMALREQGVVQTVYMGSDAPSLMDDDFAAVRSCLDRSDAVLVPAADGGVVLMANRCAWPDLDGLPWSTDCLCDALAAQCRAEMASVSLLNEGCDIDEPRDVLRLTQSLATDRRPARRVLHALASEIAMTMNIDSDHTHA